MEGAAGPAQGIVGPAVVPVEFLLGAVPVLVRGVPGEAGDVEWVHHRRCGREFLVGGGLAPGEPVHRDHLHSIAPCFGAWCQPRLERGFGVALDHVEQPGRSGPGQDGVVGGVPRHGQRLSDPGQGQVLHHKRNQRPP